MRKLIYSLLITSVFFVFQMQSQAIDYSVFTIPKDLKENANAVVRDNSIEIIIEDLDKMIVRKRKVVTVLNKIGNVDAKIGESYDNDTKITELTAYIYNGFGKEIKKYKERDFSDVSAVDGGTLYSDARVKYVDYTPISYPYTLVFESEYKTSTTGFIPWWYPVNGYHISVQKSSYTIQNPNAIPWHFKRTNFKNFNIKSAESETAIQYILENQKAFVYERNTIAYRDLLPKALIALDNFKLKGVEGAYTNWKDFGKWMHEKLLLGRDELDEATVAAVQALVKDVQDPIEKAKIVYKFMQEKTRYISVQVGIGGWEPIAANTVDAVGYGDCKGLTNYTKALLEAVGVTAYYTVVYADEKRDIDKEFSSIQGNHVILNLPNKDGNDIWLECTSQTTPFGFLGSFTHDRNVLVVTPEGGIIKKTTSYKDETNLQTLKGEIQLLDNGDLQANLKRSSKGLQYDDKFYLETISKEELIKNYKSNVWDYNNNLEIESVVLKNDKENVVFEEDLEVSIKNYATINENEFLFRVNVFNRDNYIPKRYRNRKLPLQISTGYKDADFYKIKLPKGYNLIALPDAKELKTKFGYYQVKFTKLDETTFKYEKAVVIKEGVYPKEDYKAYRSFRRSIAKHENLRIAITKNLTK
ncbi:DUF3857 domain-containing protein [uncultured Polaribacter sp.]|uniref:DUF3857 domain-containing protein n=1 Tax=uncultured Polaribacter sp. TaxID=174711 RepID=UPI00261CC912|nr:DUF3857 domain-containing protein [uncultured Polaribacter sp.]